MKKISYIIVGLVFVLTSCVDDYLDARPDALLDGPGAFISTTGDEVVATDTDDDTFTYVPNGGTAVVEISVVDAPGLIDSVSVSLSNIQRPEDWGTIAIEGFEQIRGQEKGTFTVVYTAPLLDIASSFNVAVENIVITVRDIQSKPKSVDLTVDSFKTQLSQGSDCFANIDLVGFYNAVSNGFNSVTAADYSDLEADIEIYMLKAHRNNPGWLRLSDGSFGLYGLQGGNNNFINFEVCGTQVVNANEEFEDGYSGTIDDATGVITIVWSNAAGDTGTTVLTPVKE